MLDVEGVRERSRTPSFFLETQMSESLNRIVQFTRARRARFTLQVDENGAVRTSVKEAGRRAEVVRNVDADFVVEGCLGALAQRLDWYHKEAA